MSSLLEVRTPASLNIAVGPEPLAFSVPARRNPRLQALVERLNADEELWQWWRCANVNALDRLRLSDHGEVHVRIVANAALRLLRLLREAGRVPGVTAQHHLGPEEAEVVVVLAAALHDVGLAASSPGAQLAVTAALAAPKARELLAPFYPPRERTILVAEALQVIAGHHCGACLTLEAGALHLADALDIAEGRLNLGNGREGQATPAASVEQVALQRGAQRPVRIEVRFSAPAGLPELAALLQRRLRESDLAGAVEVAARLPGRPAAPWFGPNEANDD